MICMYITHHNLYVHNSGIGYINDAYFLISTGFLSEFCNRCIFLCCTEWCKVRVSSFEVHLTEYSYVVRARELNRGNDN